MRRELSKGKTAQTIFAAMFVLAVFSFAHPASAAGVETQITNDSADQFDPYISGDKIVWDDWRNTNNPEIYMYDVATKNETRITDNSWGQYAPVISGNNIFWTDFRSGNMKYDIYKYDLTTHNAVNLINAPENQRVWGVSGDRIVWTDDRNLYKDIYTYDLGGQLEIRLTNGSENRTINNAPSIAGNRIVWQSTGENQNWDYEIYVHDLVTGVTSKIITDPNYNQQLPSISGDKIVWQDNRNGNEDIYMYDLLTQTETQITHNISNQLVPKISGNRIVWLDGRNHNNGAYDIYMYDLNSHVETRITADSARVDGTISISGDRIVWQDRRNGRIDIYMYEITNPPVNIDPIAQIGQIATTFFGQTTSFDGSASSDSDGTITNYYWDFGDGSTGDGATANHAYASAGTYQATLTVTDNDGATATAATTVKVDALPVAHITPVATRILGEIATFDGSASSDPDGFIVDYSWNFGDGSNANGSNATYIYAAAGTYQVTLTVMDNDGATGTATAMVIIQTSSQAINSLIMTVQNMNLAQGITNSLDSKLQNADDALSAANVDNRGDAINKLQAFISATQAQSGNQLTIDQANQLIEMANRLISVLQ